MAFKSSKILPVMFVGTIILQKRYSAAETLCAVLVCAGLTEFALADGRASQAAAAAATATATITTTAQVSQVKSTFHFFFFTFHGCTFICTKKALIHELHINPTHLTDQDGWTLQQAARVDTEPWACTSCTVVNIQPPRKPVCQVCGQPRADLVSTGQLDSKRPPPGMWRCKTCTVFNKDAVHFCSLCETARES